MVEPVERHLAGRGLDHGRRRDAAGLERPGGDERLHRRAGLEGVGQRAVAQLRAGQVLAVGGRVAREVGERQHLAGLRIEDDDAAGLGLVRGDRVADPLVGEELHLRVDRQADVLALERRDAVADVLDDAAEPVLDDAARAVAAGELLLERELDAFLAVVLDVGEADDVRRRLALGVLALVLAHLVDALDRRDRVTALATLSSTWRRSQTKFGLSARRASSAALVMSSSVASRARARGVAFEVLRDRPDRRRRNARGEDQAVAVDDPAAARRQLDRVAVADLALAQEERRVDDLHVDGAAEQQQEAEADRGDEQLRAPRRRRRGEQRAGRVAEALDARRARAPWRSSSSRRGSWRRPALSRPRRWPRAARRTASPPASPRASPAARARSARRAAASPASAARSSAARCRCRARAPRSAPCRARRTGGATRTRRAPGRGCWRARRSGAAR